MQKTLSFLPAFFAVLLLREKQNNSLISPTFLCTIYLENEEKTGEKNILNVFQSI